MKTETEGLSREEFEKAMKRDNRTWEFDRDEVGKYRKIEPCYAWIGWQAASSLKQAPPDQVCPTCGHKAHPAGHCGYSVGAMDTGCECKFEGKQTEPEPCACPGCGEPKSAVIHRTEFGAYVDNRPRHNFMAEGKQAEPPSLCAKCGMYSHAYEHDSSIPAWRNANYHTFVPVRPESPSQASTQPPYYTNLAEQMLVTNERTGQWVRASSVQYLAEQIAASHSQVSQATKEDWARRIADMQPQWFEDEPPEVFYETVLAILKGKKP